MCHPPLFCSRFVFYRSSVAPQILANLLIRYETICVKISGGQRYFSGFYEFFKIGSEKILLSIFRFPYISNTKSVKIGKNAPYLNLAITQGKIIVETASMAFQKGNNFKIIKIGFFRKISVIFSVNFPAFSVIFRHFSVDGK